MRNYLLTLAVMALGFIVGAIALSAKGIAVPIGGALLIFVFIASAFSVWVKSAGNDALPSGS